MRSSLQAYNKVKIGAQAAAANPHKVVQMLLAGAIEKSLRAKLAIEQQQTAQKGELIGRAIDIISHLQAALDHNTGGELAENLSSIYGYAVRRLGEANATNDGDTLVEVAGLLRTLKEGWDAIPSEHHHLPIAG